MFPSQLPLACAAAVLTANAGPAAASTMPDKPTPTPARSAEALRERIGADSYRCSQEGGTEPPFRNAYWNHHANGIYVDVVSGEALFSSQDKFDSGTGWPSFSRPLTSLKAVRDTSLGMQRTEVRSPDGNSHLGHLFDDGPGPDGQRFCINSASLRFVAVEDMRKEGYGAYLFAFAEAKKWEVATLAGGCFWGMEKMFEELPGVVETQVGYAGGDLTRATYADVTTGTTRNAEALQVLFDPKKVSYSQLLLRFFSIHDPTTRDQQGHDRGTQYRSAIYFASAAQQKAAAEVVARVNDSGRWKKPVVTELAAFTGFVRAERMHQKYLAKTPNGYSCHVDRHLQF